MLTRQEDVTYLEKKPAKGRPNGTRVVCHFDLPHMAQKVADWTRREGRPRADEMAHGAVCRFELPHVAENNRRVTRVDSSLWPQRTVPKLPSGTNGCQTLKTATLNTSYFCQKRPLCQPPPSPTPPPNSHFVRKVKLRLAYRLAFVIIPAHLYTVEILCTLQQGSNRLETIIISRDLF